MPRKARASRGLRPKQGVLLLALRQKAGLTQTQVAKAVGVPQPTIAFWEWSEAPPRSEVLPTMAKIFGVQIEALIAADTPKLSGKDKKPVGEVQRVFEEVRRLPRKQQKKVVEMVTALVEQYKRSAHEMRKSG